MEQLHGRALSLDEDELHHTSSKHGTSAVKLHEKLEQALNTGKEALYHSLPNRSPHRPGASFMIWIGKNVTEEALAQSSRLTRGNPAQASPAFLGQLSNTLHVPGKHMVSTGALSLYSRLSSPADRRQACSSQLHLLIQPTQLSGWSRSSHLHLNAFFVFGLQQTGARAASRGNR
jgi:hypothetical protein